MSIGVLKYTITNNITKDGFERKVQISILTVAMYFLRVRLNFVTD